MSVSALLAEIRPTWLHRLAHSLARAAGVHDDFEAHGGTLWVESEGCDEVKCPGSTFHVLLPIRTEPSDPKIAKLFGLDAEQKETQNVQENP